MAAAAACGERTDEARPQAAAESPGDPAAEQPTAVDESASIDRASSSPLRSGARAPQPPDAPAPAPPPKPGAPPTKPPPPDLFDPDTIPHFELGFDAAAMAVLTSTAPADKEAWVHASFKMGSIQFDDVGVRRKGSSTFR